MDLDLDLDDDDDDDVDAPSPVRFLFRRVLDLLDEALDLDEPSLMFR